ncbi:hypothetical protein MKZ38_007615 [Zalerion maritima]|uniref:Small-subunit processome Utp12 domain-containing protein n=1 Tax=Zalerion maritima TaxID=339359 RepID=A0AAD5RYX5_9PEZI|nr:hypothetical protein MKZ38_007615 [Zalerion maritima]
MSTKRKAASKLAMPVNPQNPKHSPTEFAIDETRTAVSTNNHGAAANATSEKANVPETIEISSGSSEYYDDSGGDEEESHGGEEVSKQQKLESQPQDEDEEMADTDATKETTSHPAAQAQSQAAVEDSDSDNAPTFGDLVRHHDPIDVPSTLTTQQQPSTALTTGTGKQIGSPSLSSLTTVLTQSLRTDDADLLESCLRIAEVNTVRNTIQRLDSVLASSLLTKLASRLHRRPGRAGTLMTWVQWTLVCHGGALAKDPDLNLKLVELQRVLRERAEGLPSLLALKGKLDMLESQIMNRRAVIRSQRLGGAGNNIIGDDSDKNEEEIIYVEGEDDSDDDMGEQGNNMEMPLVNGNGMASDDSDDEDEEVDLEEEDESHNGEEVYEDDDVDHEDVDEEEEEEDSDIAEAAAAPPPAKIQKTAGGFAKRR